jgi:hypothetical protein
MRLCILTPVRPTPAVSRRAKPARMHRVVRWRFLCSNQCTFLQEQAVDYLQTSFLDTPPSSPSNGTNMHVESCGSESLTDGSPICQCTRETFGCSIHPRTRDEWIASMRDSLAKIFPSQGGAKVSMASEADYTAKSSAALAWYDHNSCSWKTHQQSLVGDWEPYLETWPRAGTMLGGQSWPLLTWVRPINANAGGALDGVPTPVASMGERGGRGETLHWVKGGTPRGPLWPTPTKSQPVQVRGMGAAANAPSRGTTLCGAVRHWATTLASDWKSHSPAKQATNSRPLREQVGATDGGPLNPTWVEWLMAWPIEWTALPPSETVRSRSARQRHGKSLEDQ